jgi:hypothetical protein
VCAVILISPLTKAQKPVHNISSVNPVIPYKNALLIINVACAKIPRLIRKILFCKTAAYCKKLVFSVK